MSSSNIHQCFCEHGTNSPECCVNRLAELAKEFPPAGKPKEQKRLGPIIRKWLVPEGDS